LARLQHLVVFLPGIGGSVLAAAGGRGGYALTTGGLARTLARPDALDLQQHPELTPTGLVHDLAVLPPLLTLPGYRRLYQHLRQAFPTAAIDVYRRPDQVDPGVDVLMFPYDFRRSVAETSIRLDQAVAALPDRPVIVLAHSLGGLVARHWIAVRQGWRRCVALLTLATPHRGAPKALDWLINGAGAGPVRDPRLTRVIRGWPSIYELLPQYEAVRDESTGNPLELTQLPQTLLAGRPRLADYADQFEKMAARARSVHDQIRTGWAELDPRRTPVIPYLTRGHATPNLVTLDSGRLRISKQDPPWRGNVGWRGDGTVPALSAIPPELGDYRGVWRVVTDRHGPIGSIPDPVEVLRSYEGERPPKRGEEPQAPWLGLDLEEFAPAGQPVPLAACLQLAQAPGSLAWVTVTALDAASPACQVLLAAAEPDETGAPQWRGELPPLATGMYEVAVEVTNVPRIESVAHASTLAVVEPACEEGDAW
jgi:hypothetical protein